ncbi:unnamed protein product [Heligmosomoides polygyrus]|uniref:Ovule protein n=1 Tax=Heligmosomoides polygyrus TaxID=6339 RepID=A0A183GRW9_HELPZ|nr:unnamed protein product [Heligmosomoides polygyrus]
MENTNVAYIMKYLLCLGKRYHSICDAKEHQSPLDDLLGNPQSLLYVKKHSRSIGSKRQLSGVGNTGPQLWAARVLLINEIPPISQTSQIDLVFPWYYAKFAFHSCLSGFQLAVVHNNRQRT